MADHTPEERDELLQIQEQYSDYYKSVFGARPSFALEDHEWNDLDFMRLLWDELHAEQQRRCETPIARAFMRSNGWHLEEPDSEKLRTRALLFDKGADVSAFLEYLARLDQFHQLPPVNRVFEDPDPESYESLLLFQGTGLQLTHALTMAARLRETAWLASDIRYASTNQAEGRAVLRYQGQTIPEPTGDQDSLAVLLPAAQAPAFAAELDAVHIPSIQVPFDAFRDEATVLFHFPQAVTDPDPILALALRYHQPGTPAPGSFSQG